MKSTNSSTPADDEEKRRILISCCTAIFYRRNEALDDWLVCLSSVVFGNLYFQVTPGDRY